MRFHHVSLLLVTALLGCATDQTLKSPTAEHQARKALEAYVLDFWVHRDVTALDRALTPDMIYHYLGRTIPGDPGAHQTSLREFGGAFPDLKGSVDVLVVNGEMGAAVTSWEGTQTGPLFGIPPSGRKASWTVNYVFRMRGSRIAELWEAWNEGGINYFLQTGKTNVVSQMDKPEGSVEQQLIKTEEEGSDAFVKGDAAFFTRVLADDFTGTEDDGSVFAKAEFLAELKSGELKFTAVTRDDYKVRVYGNAAVITYRQAEKGQYKGKDFEDQFRLTETWIQRAGHWQCVVVHVSKIAEKK
jgi:predicted ester cyclase